MSQSVPEPVTMSFPLPENCPPDIEMMALWASVWASYKDKLSGAEMRACARWFNSYVTEQIGER